MCWTKLFWNRHQTTELHNQMHMNPIPNSTKGRFLPPRCHDPKQLPNNQKKLTESEIFETMKTQRWFYHFSPQVCWRQTFGCAFFSFNCFRNPSGNFVRKTTHAVGKHVVRAGNPVQFLLWKLNLQSGCVRIAGICPTQFQTKGNNMSQCHEHTFFSEMFLRNCELKFVTPKFHQIHQIRFRLFEFLV